MLSFLWLWWNTGQNAEETQWVPVLQCAWAKSGQQGKKTNQEQKCSFWLVKPVVTRDIKMVMKESCLCYCGQEAEESTRIQYSTRTHPQWSNAPGPHPHNPTSSQQYHYQFETKSFNTWPLEDIRDLNNSKVLTTAARNDISLWS